MISKRKKEMKGICYLQILILVIGIIAIGYALGSEIGEVRAGIGTDTLQNPPPPTVTTPTGSFLNNVYTPALAELLRLNPNDMGGAWIVRHIPIEGVDNIFALNPTTKMLLRYEGNGYWNTADVGGIYKAPFENTAYDLSRLTPQEAAAFKAYDNGAFGDGNPLRLDKLPPGFETIQPIPPPTPTTYRATGGLSKTLGINDFTPGAKYWGGT